MIALGHVKIMGRILADLTRFFIGQLPHHLARYAHHHRAWWYLAPLQDDRTRRDQALLADVATL